MSSERESSSRPWGLILFVPTLMAGFWLMTWYALDYAQSVIPLEEMVISGIGIWIVLLVVMYFASSNNRRSENAV